VAGDLDVEWIVPVQVGPGRTRRDLGQEDARGAVRP
jgi:hypothetical protein